MIKIWDSLFKVGQQSYKQIFYNLNLNVWRMQFWGFKNPSHLRKPEISLCSVPVLLIYLSSFTNLAHAWSLWFLILLMSLCFLIVYLWLVKLLPELGVIGHARYEPLAFIADTKWARSFITLHCKNGQNIYSYSDQLN